MEIIEETNGEIVNMKVDITNEELENLISYFHNNCPEEVKNELMVSWSVQNILSDYANSSSSL
jgi:hypothetical protein